MGTRTTGKRPGLYKRGRYWWITKDPIEGRAISTRCSDLKAAKDFQAERERLGANPAYAASQAARLGDECDRYLAMKERSGTRPVTMRFLRTKLGHWIRIHSADAPLSTFAAVAVWDAYFEQRQSEGAVQHTIMKETQALRRVLRSAARGGRFAGDLLELRPEGLTTSYVPRERALTMDETALLVPQLSGKPRALVCLAIALGVRLGEAAKLSMGAIDRVGGSVTVRGTKTKGSNRDIPILSPFRILLDLATSEPMPIGVPNNLRRDILAACKRAGIAPATMNDFRRTHASVLAELGAGEEHTAKLLGHNSTEMVKRVYSKPRAIAMGRLIERSIGVVGSAQVGAASTIDAEGKSAEEKESGPLATNDSGFLSRRSQIQILPGAPNNSLGRVAGDHAARTLSHRCSDVGFLLASAAFSVGQLHDGPVERPAIGSLDDERRVA